MKVVFASIIRNVPIPIAGVALGLAALGILLSQWSSAAYWICGGCSALCVVLLALKIVLFPKLIRDDLRNPIMASTSGTLFMTLMQLSTYLAPYNRPLAFGLWAVMVAGHGALILWFTLRFIRGLKLRNVFPTYFICYVGIIVGSATSPTYGMQSLGFGLFWFGFACYAVLLVLVTCRYLKHEVPEAARPLFCIYAAPMSLSLVGYLATAPEPHVGFVVAMVLLAQGLFLFVLFHLPKFIRMDFYPSYAAMTFPFVIAATALWKVRDFLGAQAMGEPFVAFLPPVLDFLLVAEAAFATVMVVYVFCHYVRFFLRSIETPKAPAIVRERQGAARFAEFFEN